jgi:hypothetical protein
MLQTGGAFGTALVGVWAGSATGLGLLVGAVAVVGAGTLWLLRHRTLGVHD